MSKQTHQSDALKKVPAGIETKETKKVLILGGGLLGATAAMELAKRGVEVELVEQASIEEFFAGKGPRASSSANIDTSRSLRSTLPSQHFSEAINFSAKYYTELQARVPRVAEFFRSNPSILVQTEEAKYKDVDAEHARLVASGVKAEIMTGAKLKERYPFLSKDLPDNVRVLFEHGYGRNNPNGSSGIFNPAQYLRVVHTELNNKDKYPNVKITYGATVDRSKWGEYDNVVIAAGAWLKKEAEAGELQGRVPPVSLVYGGYYNHVGIPSKPVEGIIPYFKIRQPEGSEVFPEIVMPASPLGGVKILSDIKKTLEKPGVLPAFPKEESKEMHEQAEALFGKAVKPSPPATCPYTMSPDKMACIGPVKGTKFIVMGYDSAAGACYAPVWATMVLAHVLGKEVEKDPRVQTISHIRNQDGKSLLDVFSPDRAFPKEKAPTAPTQIVTTSVASQEVKKVNSLMAS